MTPKTAKTLRLIFAILGILAGLGMIAFAFVVWDYSNDGNWTLSVAFGGDFYTEIHDAVSDASCNLVVLQETVGCGFIGLLLMLGAADIAFFGHKLVDALEIPAPAAAPAPAIPDAFPQTPVQPVQPVSPQPVYPQSSYPQPTDPPQFGGQ